MKFEPPRWIRNAHVQTLGAALPLWAPPRGFSPARDEQLFFPLDAHGEGFGLVGRGAFHAGGPRRTALLVHGVGGDVDSQYMRRAAVALYRAGMHVVRLNLRGAGEGIRTAPSLYHAALTADLDLVVRELLADPRVSSLLLVGFSLGGNASLFLAGTWGDAPPRGVDGVVAISPPLDLTLTSRALERLRSFPYARYVLRGLVDEAKTFAELRPERARYDATKLARLKTVRAYDELVVAPMHGFPDAATYYQKASSGPWLGKIVVPTLLVHAADDPMVPEETMRAWLGTRSDAVELAWSERGGHVGWFGGVDEGHFIDTWPMKRTIAFVERLAAGAVTSPSARSGTGR